MTGRYEICDPTQGCINDGGRSVFLNATRDGNIWIRAWTYSGPDFDNLDALTAHLMTCTGGLTVTGADINGTASCKGQFPATTWPNGGHTDYRTVSVLRSPPTSSRGLMGLSVFTTPRVPYSRHGMGRPVNTSKETTHGQPIAICKADTRCCRLIISTTTAHHRKYGATTMTTFVRVLGHSPVMNFGTA